jgi:hypothetical protein
VRPSSFDHDFSDQSSNNDFYSPGLGIYSTGCFLLWLSSTLAKLYARFSNLVLRLVRTRVCTHLKLSIYSGDQELDLRIYTDPTLLCWMNIAPAAIDERMPVQRLNQVGDATLRRESPSLPSSLNPILEVEEENVDDLPRTTMPTPSSQQWGPEHAPRKRRYMWFCCQCGDGPSDSEYVSNCTECYHRRCGTCSVNNKRAEAIIAPN